MNNTTALEIMNRASWIHAANDVLEKHPKWQPKWYGPKRLVVLDHFRPEKDHDTSHLIPEHVSLPRCWQSGKNKVSELLMESQLFETVNFFTLPENITMLKPKGKRVGVSENQEFNWSQTEDEIVIDQEEDVIVTAETPATIDDYLTSTDNRNCYHPTITVDDKAIHKATIIREIFNSSERQHLQTTDCAGCGDTASLTTQQLQMSTSSSYQGTRLSS